MRQKAVQVHDGKTGLNPCQLKKLWGHGIIACSMLCAFENGCPVVYIDSHDFPLTDLRRYEKVQER